MKNLIVILFLFLGITSSAQIISYVTGDTIQIDIPTAGTEVIEIDIDQDGINDLSIQKSTSTDSQCSIWGLPDSTDILQEYFSNGGMTGWKLRGMSDSIISDNSDWIALQSLNPTAIVGGGMLHHTSPLFPTTFVNSQFYLGFRIWIEGSDFIYRPYYGCLDATLTVNEKLIVHGWSYQSQPNIAITCTDSLLIPPGLNIIEYNVPTYPYPNPSSLGKFKIGQNIGIINVYSLDGKEVDYNYFESVLDISHLPKGIYFANINGNFFKLIFQ